MRRAFVLALFCWLLVIAVLVVTAAVLMNIEAHKGYWFVNA